MDLILYALSLIPRPMPDAAADAVVEAWVNSPAEVPNDMPPHLGPAIERWQRGHDLWNWGAGPVWAWSSDRVRSEILWTRDHIRCLSMSPMADRDRLPTSEEITFADQLLSGRRSYLCSLMGFCSPMDEPLIRAEEARLG